MDWANFSPKNLISPSGPGSAQKAGLGQDSPGPATKTGGGNYFPPTPACRTLFVLHAEKEKKNKTQEWGRRRVTWRGGGGASLVCRLRWRCCGGGRWRCQAALWFQQQLQAVLLSPTVQRRSSRFLADLLFSHVPSRFLAFLPLSVGFSVSLSSISVDFLSYSLSSVFFFFRVLSLFFSLFFRFSPLFRFLLFPPPVPFSAFLGSIYRAKGVAFYCSHGEQPAGRPLGATAKVRLSPVFWQVRGRPVCSVGGLQAREGPAKFKQKPLFSFFPAAMFGGKKKEEQCRSKRHRSALSFFSFFF